MSAENETRSLAEVEAFAAAERTQGHARAVDDALAELENALGMAGPTELERQAQRLREFHRLFMVRLASIVRQLGEGA